jgi:hypothetical protein
MPHGVWFVIHFNLDLDGIYFLLCKVLPRPLTDRPGRVVHEYMFRTLRFGPGDPE